VKLFRYPNMQCSRTFSIVVIVLVLMGTQRPAMAQDIVRLEFDASDPGLPIYTVPAGRQGVVFFRGAEIRNRRVVRWELLHHDVALKEIHRETFEIERGEYFAGWKVDENHLYLLFFHDQPVRSGHLQIYDLTNHRIVTRGFHLDGNSLQDPVFRVAGGSFYLSGVAIPDRREQSERFGALFSSRPARRLVCVTGSPHREEVIVNQIALEGIRGLLHAQPHPASDGVLLAVESDDGRHQRRITTIGIRDNGTWSVQGLPIPSSPEICLANLCYLSTDSFPLAAAGTYGSLSKREWNRDEPVESVGLFFVPLEGSADQSLRLFPFRGFKRLLGATARRLAQSGRSNPPVDDKGNIAFRVLLHDLPYKTGNEIVIVGETYFPEYEYDQRVQQYYLPYSYYGYYPGFYDRGGRWIFKGFRYEYALVAAFDPTGNLLWENSFEASDILDKQLVKRINLLAYDGEIVMVYAHEGRVFYRVIQEDQILVDRESFPIELPSPGDRAREHYATNMARWYDNFFIVWGRQTIRNTDGRSRTVFYCNKIAFE